VRKKRGYREFEAATNKFAAAVTDLNRNMGHHPKQNMIVICAL
jgi:hypothetical protein